MFYAFHMLHSSELTQSLSHFLIASLHISFNIFQQTNQSLHNQQLFLVTAVLLLSTIEMIVNPPGNPHASTAPHEDEPIPIN